MDHDDWKTMIILGEGEALRHEGSRTKGFMQEEDIDTYSIIRSDGTKVGSVTVRDHTAVKGFRRTIHVTQNDVAGKQVMDKSYTVN